MKIEAEIKNLKWILANDENFYQIPDYQRPYSWDKDQVSDLIDDLVTAFIENRSENRSDPYFCGSLVLIKNKSDSRFDIIDGQQRMTTFIIISCVFRNIYPDLSDKANDFIKDSIQYKYDEEKRKLKFLTDEQYQINFEATVLKESAFEQIGNIEKMFPDNKYLQNAYHIQSLLKEKIIEHSFEGDDFVIWFFENVVLTVITCPSEDRVIQIFNVLNDRGMPLSSIDILKSSLMQKLNGKEDRNSFKTTWGEINTNLKHEDFDLDGMLTTYLYYKISTNPKKRLDKELLDVFEKEGKDSLEIIQEIRNFSKAYIKTLTAEDKNLYCLRYLKHEIYWRSILSTASYLKYSHLEELKKLLVAYYYQHWIAGATVARIKQTSFNILKHVKNKTSIDKIKSEM